MFSVASGSRRSLRGREEGFDWSPGSPGQHCQDVRTKTQELT